MSELPPEIVFDSFNAPSTEHFRRIEIYEADGVTRWGPDLMGSRLIEGSISVDYSRDERRTLDLRLDNSDSVLASRPSEFWYDKIIKAYRGVVVNEAKRVPRVLLYGTPDYSETLAILEALRGAGFSNVTVGREMISFDQMLTFDIIVHGQNGANVSPWGDNIVAAYERGKSVLSLAGVSSIILAWLGATTGNLQNISINSDGPGITPSMGHPVAVGWTAIYRDDIRAEAGNSTFSYMLPKASITRPGRIPISDGATHAYISAFGGPSTGQWVIYHPDSTSNEPFLKVQEFRNFMRAALNWLDPIVPMTMWETQVGEFMIDRISEAHFPNEVSLTLRDYSKKCIKSKFLQATQFAKGLAMEDIIASIAGAAGITKRLLPNTGVVVNRSFFFDRGVTRWEAMKEIASSYDHELYFDARGYLVMRPLRDPLLTSPVISFRTGSDYGNLVGYEKSTSDGRLYNVILVSGESSDEDTIPVWAVARNDNPTSPTSTQRIGERVYEYTSSFITTKAQAQEVADSFLAVHALEEYEISFSSLLYPWLEVGDIIEFLDPKATAEDPTTFLLSTLTIPLGLAPMEGSAKRVVKVG